MSTISLTPAIINFFEERGITDQTRMIEIIQKAIDEKKNREKTLKELRFILEARAEAIRHLKLRKSQLSLFD